MELRVFLDNEKNLVAGTEEKLLKGTRAKKIISEALDNDLKKIIKSEDKIVLLYNDDIIRIYNYDEILSDQNYKDVFRNVHAALYDDSERASKNLIARKVARRNKYRKNRLIATGVALAMLTSGAKFTLDKVFASDNISMPTEEDTIEEELDNEKYTITTDENGNIYHDLYGQTQEEINSDLKQLEQNQETISEVVTSDIAQTQEEANIVETIVEAVNQNKNINDVAVINYKDRSNSDKVISTDQNYGSIIHYYADMYGIDGDLMIAIATQEKGFHENKMDEGGGTGIMQIQDVHDGETLTAYNFITNEYDYEYVTLESMKELDNNIKYGCMIYQNYLHMMNYNPIAATQAYNMGPGTVEYFYDQYCFDTGKEKKEVISNPYDLGWMNYINDFRGGDINYLSNVYSYRGNNFDMEFKRVDDGTWHCVKVSNNAVQEYTQTK